MPDPRVCLEALSALSGCRVESTPGRSQIQPQDLVNIVALREFYKQEGLQELDYPSIGTMSLQDPDPDEPDLYGPAPSLTAGPDPGPGPGPALADRKPVKLNPEDFFHPQYDYDFTRIQDGDRRFLRGNEQYVRPCGWDRAALRVTQRYADGDGWLGTGRDAWPVSYQGHGMDGSIILVRGGEPEDEPGYLEAAAARLTERRTQGRGVYSTPDVRLAEKFCKTFRSQVDGKKYKVLLQNRINPETRSQCQREDVWVVYIQEGLNDVQTRALVEDAIRPYGLLLKEA
ncbi:uncharacterized protein LOC115409199 [Salarias fasciatus]|uniref:uncharacterized protein LOC115409199 n=1 Tax=Salarias fasciatus TaxID=181472 RepID=UPI00117684A8|nr:uncharacterized protein LOC115409199 [Salarias fasciatus]